MEQLLYVACDGGENNTMAGDGGILEVVLGGKYQARYWEFPSGTGGSVHQVKPSPGRRYLAASCGNHGQIYLFPRRGGGFDLESYRVIDSFVELGPPPVPWDGITSMFDFLDEDTLITTYNRRLLRVDVGTGAKAIIADFSPFLHPEREFLHQVAVHPPLVVVDDALGGILLVHDLETGKTRTVGDGFSGGHFHLYLDERGHVCVARPSFNFELEGAAFKLMHNCLSVFDLTAGTGRSFSYAMSQPNHGPVDMFVDGPHLFCSYAVPGSVLKIDLRDGRIVDGFHRRPGPLTRLGSMALDFKPWGLTYGTYLRSHDKRPFSLYGLVQALAMGWAGGSRGGFFTLADDPESDRMYAVHRGLNRLYCLSKRDLKTPLWSRDLPLKPRSDSPLYSGVYRSSRYLARGLGAHHGVFLYL